MLNLKNKNKKEHQIKKGMDPNSSNNLAVYLGTSNVLQWRRVQ